MFTKVDIEKYFVAEKQASIFFMVIGILALLAAVYFFFSAYGSLGKGIAIPLVVIAILQIVVGTTVYRRSDAQRIDNVYAYDMDPGKLRNEEVPRMEKVMKNFVVLRWVEIVLIIGGVALIPLFLSNLDRIFWSGFGIGLSVQALLMLVADQFAEKRAHIYLDGLRSFLRL